MCSAWRVNVERGLGVWKLRFISPWRGPNGERFHVVSAPAFAIRGWSLAMAPSEIEAPPHVEEWNLSGKFH